MTKDEFKKRAEEIVSDNITNIRRPPGNLVSDIAQALEQVRNETLDAAIQIADNYGITVNYHEEHQPWAAQVNLWFRAQNHEISKRIRALKGEP